MKLPDGRIEYFYNFLDYVWTVDGEEMTGHAYFDHIRAVSVFVPAARLRDDTKLQPIVRFLQRQFHDIKSFHADDVTADGTGYMLVYRHHKAPVEIE